MKKRAIKILLGCLLIVGGLNFQSCKSASVTKTTTENYAKTNPSDIEVFVSEKPTRQYIEIGTVSVLRIKSKMLPLKRPAEKIMKDMKEKAAGIGGHAIINYRESGEANMTGTVIRYK